MKKIIFINLFLSITIFGFAQKQTFDVISFDIPKGWDKTVTENGVQLSTKDDGKGNYAAMVIVRSVASNASASDNFNKSWENLVKGTVKVTEAPSMSDMDIEKGWNVITGQANYTDGAAKGLVTLITATGNEKMANVVVITNTDKYQEEILAFVNSLEIIEPATEQYNTSNANNNTDQNSIVGIWGQYQNESNTAGYDYREYYFNADGTYQFLGKNISYLYHNDIIYVYEKGTYKLNGNKLSISPQSGSVESWSKAGSDKPGKLLKTEKRPLESVTYNIDFHYFSGINETNLILQHNKQTLRDGAWSTNNSFKNSWLYKRPFTPNKSAIELPAGTKISLNKSSGS